MQRYEKFARIVVTIALLAAAAGCTLPRSRKTPTPLAAVQTIVLPKSVGDGATPAGTPLETLSPAGRASDTPQPAGAASTTKTLNPAITACPTRAGWPAYIVQPGENLFRIALRYNMTAEDLRIANCLPESNLILAGQSIYVPYSITLPPAPAQPVAQAQVQSTSVPPTQGPNVKEEISFDPGGENEVPVCASPTLDGTRQITSSERVVDMYQLCVYGFPMGEQVTVELNAPDGHFVASKDFTVRQQASGTTIVRVSLWAPVGAPLGTWSARAKSATGQVTKAFPIQQFGEAAINTVPSGEINPFEKHKCAVYSAGQIVTINGTNFTNRQTLPVGIYLSTPDAPQDKLGRFIFPLLSTQIAEVNQGSFSIQITVQVSDTAGVYWVLPIIDPNETVYKRIDTRNDCYKIE